MSTAPVRVKYAKDTVVSLVLAVLGIGFSTFFLLAILAIVCGLAGLRNCRTTGLRGHRFAQVGIALGIADIALGIVTIKVLGF
jgi:hypothetical protein